MLRAGERSLLLRLARLSLEDALRGTHTLDAALGSLALSAPLLETRGAFVTLREKRGTQAPRLRGCIGTLEATTALYRNVVRNSAHAALDDPRFAPLKAAELCTVQIEISALTPLLSVDGPEAIVLGRDGVLLEKGDLRAVFLPQVAVEQGWSTEQLLEHLARKAALPADGWKNGKLQTFEAEVFEEESSDTVS